MLASNLRDYFFAYQDRLDRLRRTPYLDYPHLIHLETQALCPAACSFCTYPVLRRKGTRMDDALIDKILTDLEAIPRDLPYQLVPYKVSDPFMEPRLMDLLARVNSRLPGAQLILHSSGVPLTEAKLRALNEVRNLYYLGLSVHDFRPEVYTRLMQLPWERTRERLDLIHSLKATGELRYKVVLARVGDGSPDDQAFADWVREHYPLFAVTVSQRGTWIGQNPGMPSPLPVPDLSCAHWFELSITATGEVALCCMDGQAEWPLGNVRETPVLELYNRPEYRRLRENLYNRKALAPCRGCSFL